MINDISYEGFVYGITKDGKAEQQSIVVEARTLQALKRDAIDFIGSLNIEKDYKFFELREITKRVEIETKVKNVKIRI